MTSQIHHNLLYVSHNALTNSGPLGLAAEVTRGSRSQAARAYEQDQRRRREQSALLKEGERGLADSSGNWTGAKQASTLVERAVEQKRLLRERMLRSGRVVPTSVEPGHTLGLICDNFASFCERNVRRRCYT